MDHPAGAICPQPVSTRCRRLSDFQPPELSDLRPPLTLRPPRRPLARPRPSPGPPFPPLTTGGGAGEREREGAAGATTAGGNARKRRPWLRCSPRVGASRGLGGWGRRFLDFRLLTRSSVARPRPP